MLETSEHGGYPLLDHLRKILGGRHEDAQSSLAAALARARVEYRALRITGAVALLIGLGLSTWGNLE